MPEIREETHLPTRAADRIRVSIAGHQHRRTSAAHQRAQRRHEPGGAEAVSARLPPAVLKRAGTEAFHQTGITGWAQINGRNQLSWASRWALDVRYVDYESLRLDAPIMLRTLVKVLRS